MKSRTKLSKEKKNYLQPWAGKQSEQNAKNLQKSSSPQGLGGGNNLKLGGNLLNTGGRVGGGSGKT